MKLGRQRKSHKGRAAIRHYANLREPFFQALSLSLCPLSGSPPPPLCRCLVRQYITARGSRRGGCQPRAPEEAGPRGRNRRIQGHRAR